MAGLKGYSMNLFHSDAVAGITLAAYAIPVSLAYATLAGLPPQYGIYGYLIGGFFYALAGTGKQLAVGPTSAISMLIGITLSGLSGGDPQRWIDLASLSALLLSGMSIIAWALKLSSIINFISETVLVGFKAGAAVIIAMTQLPRLFGVEDGAGNFFDRAAGLAANLPELNVSVLVFGLCAIVLLVAGEKYFPGRPVPLVVVILSVLAVTFIPEDVAVVGVIPGGLPAIRFPSFSLNDVAHVLPLSFACFLLAYIESVSAARTLAQKNGYEIDARRELLALGVANLMTSVGQGYPVSGGLSQSLVNEKAGAKTTVSLLVASAVVGLSLLFLTGLLRNLPYVVLAAIVLVAVSGLVDIKEMRRMLKVNRFDFVVAVTAMAGVIIFGILHGVLIASLFSLILIIRNVSNPNVAFLGRIPGTNRYTDIRRHPDNELLPGVLLFRVESALVYFNAAMVYNRVWTRIKEMGPALKIVVFDLSTSATIDSSGSRLIKRLYTKLKKNNIDFRVAEAHAGVRDMLRYEGMEHLMGHISRRDTLHDVIVSAVGEEEPAVKRTSTMSKSAMPSEIISQIVLGNNYFTQTHPKEYFESFHYEQKPYITLVSCSDSRVPLNSLMPDTSNRVFSIMNIGNQILSTEGSVDYGVLHLKTPVLLFLGHSDCHAIESYLNGFEDELYSIKHELDFLRPSIKEMDKGIDRRKLLTRVIERNLDYQVNIACKKYGALVNSGKLQVMAGFYDFHGEFGKGMGDIVIVNVNRMKNTVELRNHPIFGDLSKAQKELHVGRFG